MSTSGSWSSANAFSCPHLLSVDLLEGRALLEPRDLPFGGIRIRDREERRSADLGRDGSDPVEEVFAPLPGGDRRAAVEVEQLAAEPVTDRTPEVLLEQAVREVRQRLTLVVRACAARCERVGERGERLRLREVGLTVGDPDLNGRVREVRAHAPPDLRVLGDRTRAVEERDVVLPPLPRAVWVGNAAAREHAREDLGASGVQAGGDRLDERRARGQQEQLRKDGTTSVIH